MKAPETKKNQVPDDAPDTILLTPFAHSSDVVAFVPPFGGLELAAYNELLGVHSPRPHIGSAK